MTHELWEDLNATVHGFLRGVTLAQLVEKQRTRTVAVVRTHAKTQDSQPVSA
jgi:Rrf2 family iron-sulfur cluster assembly transcriptional regulator